MRFLRKGMQPEESRRNKATEQLRDKEEEMQKQAEKKLAKLQDENWLEVIKQKSEEERTTRRSTKRNLVHKI